MRPLAFRGDGGPGPAEGSDKKGNRKRMGKQRQTVRGGEKTERGKEAENFTHLFKLLKEME